MDEQMTVEVDKATEILYKTLTEEDKMTKNGIIEEPKLKPKKRVVRTEYLKYLGNKDEGHITIMTMRPGSPFRTFRYRKGGRYAVGKDVNPSVAVWLVKYHRKLFEIETVETEGDAAFVVEMANLLSVYKPILKIDKMEDFLPLIERSFASEGSNVKIKRVIHKPKQKQKKN